MDAFYISNILEAVIVLIMKMVWIAWIKSLKVIVMTWLIVEDDVDD